MSSQYVLLLAGYTMCACGREAFLRSEKGVADGFAAKETWQLGIWLKRVEIISTSG